MAYANSRFTTSSTSSVKLNIVASTNATHKPAWEIQRTSSSSCMNQWGGAAFGVELGEWTKGDQNNPLLFIPAPKKDTSIDFIENSNNTQFNIENKTLEITGENIKKVNIYSLTGQLLDTKTGSFTFAFRNSGFYLVSVIYNDNSVYNKKVML